MFIYYIFQKSMAFKLTLTFDLIWLEQLFCSVVRACNINECKFGHLKLSLCQLDFVVVSKYQISTTWRTNQVVSDWRTWPFSASCPEIITRIIVSLSVKTVSWSLWCSHYYPTWRILHCHLVIGLLLSLEDFMLWFMIGLLPYPWRTYNDVGQ